MPYLMYNKQGSIQLVSSLEDYKYFQGFAAPNYTVFEDIPVGNHYDQVLTKTFEENPKEALSPALALLLKLFVTFLLSEDGQYFMSKVINWIYKLWLSNRVNKFIKRYRDHIDGISDIPIDKLRSRLYDEALELLQYQLNADEKLQLYRAFKGE